MRILLVCRSFNSLTQRLHVELTTRGHVVSVEHDINDTVTAEAVDLFQPDLVLASYLTRRLPESVWGRVMTWVVHPGPMGDRGPSALDWAILDGRAAWGVTVLEARAELDAGPVWATAEFPMRATTKGDLYRDEVTTAAVTAVMSALDRLERGLGPSPSQPGPAALTAGWRPLVTQDARAIDWAVDDTWTVLRKIRASDGQPGVRDVIHGQPFFLYDAWREDGARGAPGELIGRRDEAVCRATIDGAVWIGAMKPDTAATKPGERSFKRPATLALEVALGNVALRLPVLADDGVHDGAQDGAQYGAGRATWRPIRYHEVGAVGFLHFDFNNGAMSTNACRRLLAAYTAALARPTRVLVLMGGAAFWSNGLDLATIEHAAEVGDGPAAESWANINALDDVVAAIINTTDRLTVAAMRGNAGAGGAFLALAADRVWARDGIVLNPHYKNMGNLYGSEYWTYLLPKRCGDQGSMVMERRLPLGVAEALKLGLVDAAMPADRDRCDAAIRDHAWALAAAPELPDLLAAKAERRAADEAVKPLAAYRAEELARMRLNFSGFDPSYHVARWHFIAKLPLARTPVHLARHRELKPLVKRGAT